MVIKMEGGAGRYNILTKKCMVSKMEGGGAGRYNILTNKKVYGHKMEEGGGGAGRYNILTNKKVYGQ